MTHLVQVRRLTGERWQTACSCGFRSPVVADRRTANQAHAAHLTSKDPS